MSSSLELLDNLINYLCIQNNLSTNDTETEQKEEKKCPFVHTKRLVSSPDKRPTYNDYLQLRKELSELVTTKQCAPIMVRLAWHDAGTFCAKSKTGGPRACMRFQDGESTYGCNNGLNVARGLIQSIVDTYHKKGFSISDIWSLCGVVAVEVSGGPTVPFRLGRSDAVGSNESVPNGRLPDGDKDLNHLRQIFNRMGFNDKEIVILSGAHTLGKCRADRSGFEGPWTAEPLKFDNQYYKDLVEKKWVKNVSSTGLPQLAPFNSTTKDDNTMMLTTDYCLFDELDTREYVLEYARSQDTFFKDFSKAFQKLLELGYTNKELYDPKTLEH